METTITQESMPSTGFKDCPSCDGSGLGRQLDVDDFETCGECHGERVVPCDPYSESLDQQAAGDGYCPTHGFALEGGRCDFCDQEEQSEVVQTSVEYRASLAGYDRPIPEWKERYLRIRE